MNAATGYERTAYYARTLGEHAPFALDLIADILFAPHWVPDDLEKEKDVVAQERGEAFDVPDDRVFELHQARSIRTSRLAGRSSAKTRRWRDRARRYAGGLPRRSHLSPERVVISVAGAFDRDALMETVEAPLRRLGGKAPQPTAPARARSAGSASEVRKLEQAHLVLSWPGPIAGR